MVKFRLLDKFNFELDSRLDKSSADAELQLYFFIPPEFGIDAYTYPKQLFYRNLVCKQRYFDKTQGMEGLEVLLIELSLKQARLSHREYRRELSKFVTQFTYVLRSEINRLLKQPKPAELLELVSRCQIIREMIKGQAPQFSQKRRLRTFRYADNYLSLWLQQKLMMLLDSLDKAKLNGDLRWKAQLLSLLRSERTHCYSAGYKSYSSDQDGARRLLNKLQLLKRCTEASSILQGQRAQIGKVTEQVVFGFAAAASMAIATAIAFQTQQMFGNFSTPFFYALVLSYILKDRFKELSRNFIYHRLSRRYYSFRYRIIDSLLQRQIARLRDTVEFTHADKLPEDVKTIRRRQHQRFATRDDMQVMVYRRHYHLRSHRFAAGQSVLRDTLVFNLSRILRNLPARTQQLYFQKDEKLMRIAATRERSINLIVRQVSPGESKLQHMRLVATRKGINLVEQMESEE